MGDLPGHQSPPKYVAQNIKFFMLTLGKQMEDIQMWLGHSNIGTIGNIYRHLDAVSKTETGAAMSKALGGRRTLRKG